MDVLFELLCLPKPPALDVSELKRANFNTLLEKTMISSSEIMKNSTLKREVSGYMTTSLSNKSHSINNTKRTIQNMLEVAIQTRNTNREKDLLRWLQFCIDTCLSQQDISTEIEDVKEIEPVSKKYIKKKSDTNNNNEVVQNSDDLVKTEPKKKTNDKKSSATKKATTTNKKKKEESKGYHVIGDSDDDYVPSEEDYDNEIDDSDSDGNDDDDDDDDKKDDDQLVPTTTDDDKKKKTKKKDESSTTEGETKKKVQRKRKPKVEYTPLFKDGAGTNAVTKYFTSNHQEANISKDGTFAKSYFFPSEESFNAFSSVLRSAQKTIDICVFSMTDDDVADILIAAKQRKVDIRIITDDFQSSIKSADAKRLQDDHKIPYKTDHSSSYMHHKFAIIDSKILINGSFNWSKNARTKNQENIIISNIPFCIKEFQGQFDTLWEKF
ncbi:unnamed protein product [Cunninghamella blakesleeana]